MLNVIMMSVVRLNVMMPSFPGMVMPIDKAPFCLSLEEVALRSGHNVLVESDNKSALIVGDP
jgi:hypothetical protein